VPSGYLDAAADFGSRGVKEADQSRHRQGQAAARIYYAQVLVQHGDLDLARAVGSRAVELAESESVLFWRAAAYSTLGWIMTRQGHTGEGVPLLARGAALQAEAGIKGTLAAFWLRWAEGQLLAGEVEEAQRIGRRALELAQQTGERGCEADALQILAAIAARAGRVELAETYHAQAALLGRELRMDPRRFRLARAS
jgi:tetratricopeptide (TPR) repeat protein